MENKEKKLIIDGKIIPENEARERLKKLGWSKKQIDSAINKIKEKNKNGNK